MRSRAATGACCLLLWLGGSGCGSETYDVREDVTYDSTIGYDGTLDFYEPKSDSGRTNRPAIPAIHGGAWTGGDKAWGEQFAEELTIYPGERDEAIANHGYSSEGTACHVYAPPA